MSITPPSHLVANKVSVPLTHPYSKMDKQHRYYSLKLFFRQANFHNILDLFAFLSFFWYNKLGMLLKKRRTLWKNY